MREQITDIIRQTAPLFKKMKVTAVGDHTKIEAFDDDKILFMTATTKQPIAEFSGEFGISNLAMLNGLLNFTSYKTDDGKMKVHHSEAGYVSEIEFRDGNGGFTRYRTMNPKFVEQPTIANIPWDITVTPTKASINELTHLSALLSEVDQTFGVKLEHKKLYVTIGGNATTTHASSVMFASDVEDDFAAPNVTFNTKHLLAILKNAGSATPCAVLFSERGLAGITFDTDHASYNFYLRAKPN